MDEGRRVDGVLSARSQMIPVCHLADLCDGETRGFDPLRHGHDTVIVIRRRDDVRVYRDLCPHERTPMAWRRHAYLNAARDRIVCHAHGAQFEIDTGLCTLGPCLGQSLQALKHPIDAEGRVWIEAPA